MELDLKKKTARNYFSKKSYSCDIKLCKTV
jgi:hypothetical protein